MGAIGTTPNVSDLERSMIPAQPPEGEPPAEQGEASEDRAELERSEAVEGIQRTDAGPSPTEIAPETDQPETPSQKKRVLGYDALLPLEQGEEYPDQLYSIAAEKWKIDPKLLEDESIRGLLRDKINSDIEIKRRRLTDEQAATAEAEGEGEEPPRAEAEPQDIAAVLESSMVEVEPLISDKGSALYAGKTVEALQALNEALESGDADALVKAQRAFTQSQMAFARMEVQHVLQTILPGAIENWVQERTATTAKMDQLYSEARELVAQDPKYAEIKALYDKGEFKSLMKEMPQLSAMQFRDPNGKALSPVENAAAQYRRAIRFIRGENPPQSTDEAFQKGIETGKKQTEKQNTVVNQGRLGQGRSASGKFTEGQSDDEHQAKLVALHEGNDPLGSKAFSG